jgi:hypothetical protein
MKFKVMVISTIIALILSTSIALATSAYTEYSGSGDLYMSTIIISPVLPPIQDTTESHTACESMDECCPNPCKEGDGGYEGAQYISNEPVGWSENYGEVENGCIELKEEIVDYKEDEDQLITTTYSTGVEGTGTAYSFVSGVPLHNYGYQYAEGSGMTWAYFSQLSELSGDFDFETIYGGGTYDCQYGYVVMENEYQLLNSPVLYSPVMLEMVCMDPGYAYATLYGNATDHLNVNVSVSAGYMNWVLETDVEGQAELNINADSNDGLDFDFDMVLE